MRLELTNAAEADLRSIFDWTEQAFGLAEAVRYQTLLNTKLAALTDAPASGRPYLGATAGTRRVTALRHFIYFRPDGDVLRIIRVLHQRMAQDRHVR